MKFINKKFTTILFLIIPAALLFSACGGSLPSNHTTQPSSPQLETNQTSHQTLSLPLRNVRFERLSSADGLSFPFVLDVFQDHLGFMWFATRSGLNKYDGYSFTVFKNQPGDPTSLDFDDLDVVFEDSDGNLWVGGAGGIDRFDRQTETFSRVDERGQVFCITEDKDGTLWVGFWHGLYGYNRETNEIIHAYPSSSGETDDSKALTNGHVRYIAEDSQGYLWVGTSAGLDRLDPKTGTFIHYRSDPDDPQSLSHNEILAIFEDRQGILWFGTGVGGLNRLDRTTGIFQHYRHDPDDPSSISADLVLSVSDDSIGNLWVGTSMGLNLYDPDKNQFIRYLHDTQNPESVSDNVIFSLFEDRSGVLWIGTANGVSKMVQRKNQFVDLSDGLNIPLEKPRTPMDTNTLVKLGQDKVFSILEDHEGTLWFGTRLGGLYRLNPYSGEVTIYKQDSDDPTSIKSDFVSAIYQDSSGELWVGTGSGWLEQWVPQTETFNHRYSLGAPIRSITEDSSGNLWIGTQGEGLFQLDANLEELIHHPFMDPTQWQGHNSLSSHIVEAAVVDKNGVLWMGTYVGGLNLWDDGQFRHFRHDPNDSSSLSQDYVLSLLEEPERDSGVLWIGTMGGGLNRFDWETETFTRYTIADGMADNIVNCILADRSGFLWLGTPKGVTRLDPLTETFRNYDEHDGASSGASHPGVCMLSESGQMYFGTPSGVFIFDPTQIQDNLNPPPIVVTSFSVNNQVISRDIISELSITLSHEENNLSFEYSALDYTAPEKNQYSYRMEGLDEDWIFAGTRRRADYQALPPGNYTFRVRGSNNDGVWNEEGIAVAIKIDPPFWMTWWFFGLIGLVAIGAAYAGYQYQVRNLEARSRDLEKQVEDRTQEINQQRLQTEALYRADEDLYRHLDLDQVLDALVNTAVHILGADKGALLCWDDQREHLIIRASYKYHPDTVNSTRIPGGQGIAGWVAETGESVIVVDIEKDPRVTHPIIEAESIRAFIQVPISVSGEVFGVFSADFLQPRSFSEDEKRLLTSLAQRAAIAIQNAQLYEQAQELAAIQERNRLARDLHDAVTQTLFSASLIAEALPTLWERDQDKGKERLEKLRQMSRGALAEMRALLLELRPTALIETNLDVLLQQLGEAVTGREGIPVSIEIDSGCDLPEVVHLAFYRIAQEALNNVLKHAHSNQVKIQLRCLRKKSGQVKQAELSIHDDGIGFDPKVVSQDHLGLGIMQERAQKIGARLTIESESGQGTLVTVKWMVDE